jgi:hypothetical protein
MLTLLRLFRLLLAIGSVSRQRLVDPDVQACPGQDQGLVELILQEFTGREFREVVGHPDTAFVQR